MNPVSVFAAEFNGALGALVEAAVDFHQHRPEEIPRF